MSPRLSPSDLFLRAQTDERLAALAAEGHGRAFAVLIERHRRRLMGHARGLVGPERDEDVVQQALLRAWRALERGAEIRHVQAWLHRIVHNTALTEIQRQVPPSEPLDEELVDPRSAALAAEQRLAAREVLLGVATLPERQRLALLGTELEGRSRRQLAAEMGLSEGAIRQLVHRARDGVRSALAAFVPLPLVTRCLRASGWLPGTGSSAGVRSAGEAAAASGLATGAIIKAGAAVLAVSAVGGLVLHERHGHRHAHQPAAHRAATRVARSVNRTPVQGRPVIVTALRSAPARASTTVTAHVAVPAATRPSTPAAGGLAPAVPQPQTSISSRRTEAATGSHHSGDPSRPSQAGGGDSSGGDPGPTRSGAGAGSHTTSSSSGDHRPSGNAAGSSGGDRSSTAQGSPSPSSDSATAPSQSDQTATSSQSDSPGGQPPPGSSSSAGTTTSSGGGD